MTCLKSAARKPLSPALISRRSLACKISPWHSLIIPHPENTGQKINPEEFPRKYSLIEEAISLASSSSSSDIDFILWVWTFVRLLIYRHTALHNSCFLLSEILPTCEYSINNRKPSSLIRLLLSLSAGSKEEISLLYLSQERLMRRKYVSALGKT